MLQKPDPGPPPDPGETLTGTCGSCGAAVVLARADASPPLNPGAAGGPAGVWHDLWTTGCGRCGAVVHLTRKVPHVPAP